METSARNKMQNEPEQGGGGNTRKSKSVANH